MLLSLPEAHRSEPRVALVAQASAKAFERESLHLCVWGGANSADHRGRKGGGGGGAKHSRLLGEVWLPVTKVYTPSDDDNAARTFSEVLWLHGQRIGRVEGSVTVTNGPKVVQLPGGFYTEHGILPIGPIAATVSTSSVPPPPLTPLAGGAVAAGAGTPSPTHAAAPGSGGSATQAASEFERPPKGLGLPKEVQLLFSLVQSLRKVCGPRPPPPHLMLA